jgi:ferrous iron transport protein B
MDTPGVVTLPPRTEDEQATARVLFDETLQAIIQVGDAKNLRRTLLLTSQLAEMGLPLVLALNMVDEAEARGVEVDYQRLSSLLDLPVVPMVAIRGQGLAELGPALQAAKAARPAIRIEYPPVVERAVAEIEPELPAAAIAGRALALLWLGGDAVAEAWLAVQLPEAAYRSLEEHRARAQSETETPFSTLIQTTRMDQVERLVAEALLQQGGRWDGLSARLGRLAAHPLWGLPVLAGVLLAVYWFVGVFGAGTLVDVIESRLFAGWLNPWVTETISRVSPWPLLTNLLVGEYGLWTMGMTYALALILPIVSVFFLAFGLLEDSGYLARLTVLSNRLFRMMGLNGKAVVPMVLGLGCVTMATLTTRILETRRERLLAILLLALAVPCSAQLGVIMGLLAGTSFTATLLWAAVVLAVLLAVGWLAARLIPGERSSLLVELPPLRWPAAASVIAKTLARVEWYLREVIPLFLLGTAALFILDRLGLLAHLIRVGEPLVVGWLGLPPEASAAFMMGFLRRDFGATGLFVMSASGLLSPAQAVVAMVTITLFIPCVASVFIIARERGKATAVAISALVFPLAFLVGGLLHRAFLLTGWGLP